jgi:hypothetical protein
MPSSSPDRSTQPISRRGARARWRSPAAGLAAAGAAALAVTAAGLAPAAAAQAPAATTRWQIVRDVHAPGAGDITAEAPVGKVATWVFDAGTAPTAWYRSSSKRWEQVPLPNKTTGRIVVAGASSATNVWAFTAGGTRSRALVWHGTKWAVARSFSKQVGGAVVLSRTDVWVFGQPAASGQRLGAWHFNGTTWTHVASGLGLEGGSGVSADDIWAFDGTNVSQWNGDFWDPTSLASLLPAATATSNPAIVGVEAESATNVYAIGTGGDEDEGGPLVLLHFNGTVWRKVAQGSYGAGTSPLQNVAADGHGGLWIPMPASGARASYLLHYASNKLTSVALPAGPRQINVESVARVPGTAIMMGGGFTHAVNNPGKSVQAVVLQYGG